MNYTALPVEDQKRRILDDVRDTLSDTLLDDTINKTWGGRDGKLSSAQAGLVAAVVAKMLDKLIKQMEAAHARELALVAGFWKLYRTPLFTSHTSAETMQEKNVWLKKSLRGTVLTWGNFVAFVGITLSCIACFYTKSYADYKDRVQSQGERIKELNDDKASMRGVILSLRGQLADREQSLAQARQEVLSLEEDKKVLYKDSERFKVLSDSIAPVVEKLSNSSSNQLAKKLSATVDKLESEAANFANRKAEQETSGFYKEEYEKELHERQQLQTQIDRLLMEKAHLTVNLTNQ